jgi:hypothetical protein
MAVDRGPGVVADIPDFLTVSEPTSTRMAGPAPRSGSEQASATSWLKTFGIELPPVNVPSLLIHA